MSVISSATLKLQEVTTDGRRFHFAHPIEIEVTNEDGVWVFAHAETGLDSYAETTDEALERFAMAIAYCWDAYVGDSREFKYERVREIREKLIALVGSVEQLA